MPTINDRKSGLSGTSSQYQRPHHQTRPPFFKRYGILTPFSNDIITMKAGIWIDQIRSPGLKSERHA